MLALFDGGEKIFDFLLAEAFKSFEALLGESIEVGKILHAPLFKQKRKRLFGEPFDVHRVLGAEMRELLHDAGRAVFVGAEQIRARFAHGAAAVGADGRFFDGHAPLGMGDRPQNFGDDLVGAADEHAGVDFDVLLREVAVVVERRAAHGRARKLHGLHFGKGGELARPPHLPEDVYNGGLRFLRFELIGDRPARELIGIAELLAHALLVDLDDGAVRQNIDLFSLHLDLVDGFLHLVGSFAHFEEGVRLKALLFQKRHRLFLRSGHAVRLIIDIVEQNFGAAERRLFGVEVADRPRRRVTGVLQGLVGVLAVVLFEDGEPHHRLAAHFERAFIGNGKREAVQGERLRGDVLPLDAVAARGSAHKSAVFVSEAHREPVELVFDGIGGVCRLLNARKEGGKLVFRDRLIEAEKPRDMFVPLKALDGLAAHPPRGGIGQHDARRPLELAKLIVEPVVLAVLHRGRVQHIVFICPSVEDPDEFLHTFVHDTVLIFFNSSFGPPLRAPKKRRSIFWG